MPILNKNIIEPKIESTISAYSNTTNTLSLLVASSALNDISKESRIPKYTSLTLPTTPSSNNQIIYLTDIDNFVIYSSGGWYTLEGFLIPSQNPLMYSWGCNTSGQLGDGTTTSKSSPVTVLSGGFTDWCQVSAGSNHTAAVRQNGTLWAWGLGSNGRLGDGTAVDKSSPVSVVGGFTDWCQVSAGSTGAHTAAVRTNGTLWTWGAGTFGRLGDGTTVAKSSPVSVIGGFTDWCQVSSGGYQTVAVRTNGTLWSWGCNDTGRLGDGTTIDKSSPVSVIGGFTDWCQVSVGLRHTLAVRQNGTLWSWGYGASGRLGDDTIVNKCSPVSVVGGFTDWCQVAAGSSHTAAVRTNGTLWTWGCGSNGRLGNGLSGERSSPTSVVGGFTNWCQVSAGTCHTVALRTNGTLWSWGRNSDGALGVNCSSSLDVNSPISLAGGFTDWCQVESGGCFVLAIRTCQVYL
jgi:alpha-tubulin suppressor-like RCC1 family protein